APLPRPALHRGRGVRDGDGGGGDRAPRGRLPPDRLRPRYSSDAGAAGRLPRGGPRRSPAICGVAHVRELTSVDNRAGPVTFETMVGRALIVAASAFACIGGVNPVQCAIDADCGASAFCAKGACIDGTRSCPILTPTFSSINSRLLQVGCGVGQLNCHAQDSSAVESGPSFVGHPYATLVNAPAANRLGSARGLVLVKPGDPGASFLITKLQLT